MPDLLLRSEDAPDGFPFAEKIARQKIGLLEEDMRRLRTAKLKQGLDFVYHKKAIFLSAEALQKIAPALGVSLETEPQDAAIPVPGEAIASPVRLLIVRADLANKHILVCCPYDQDPDRPKNTVRVRVKSKEGFRNRTAIEARLVPGYEDLYDLTSKYPRRKAAE